MQRRAFIKVAGAGAGALLLSNGSRASGSLTFLVAHGAWSAGWSWKKMHPLITHAGHRLITPTYTGLGERSHLADASNDLELHIQDLLQVIKYEQLERFVLVAHSYGGMVATGLADRIPELIAKIVYVDAFVPRHGQSLYDLLSLPMRKRMQDSVTQGDGWRVTPNPSPPDTSAEDLRWIESRRIPQSVKCFSSAVKLQRGDTKIPRAYLRCTRIGAEDVFLPFAKRAQHEGWIYRELDASHSPQITAPKALADMLVSAAAE